MAMASPCVALAWTNTALAVPRLQQQQQQITQQLHAVRFHRHSELVKHIGGGHGAWCVPSHTHPLRAIFNSERNSSASANEDGSNLPPPGCSRIKVELTKPLGIAFEEDKSGNIIVGEVIKDSNAYKSGLVDAGDQLIATSAIIYGTEEDYQGVMVRKGMQIVRLNVRGEKFETVMAAIGTHPAYIKVALELQKCEPLSQSSTNGSARN